MAGLELGGRVRDQGVNTTRVREGERWLVCSFCRRGGLLIWMRRSVRILQLVVDISAGCRKLISSDVGISPANHENGWLCFYSAC